MAARGIDVEQNSVDEDGRQKVTGFVRAETTEPQADKAEITNPDEIVFDDEESEDEEDIVSQVPDSVFGSLAAAPEEEPLGAKDRFMKRKRD